MLTASVVFRVRAEFSVHCVGVTTQQDARLQFVQEFIGADVDAVQCTQPVAEVLFHSV